jgi:hypothetical protein
MLKGGAPGNLTLRDRITPLQAYGIAQHFVHQKENAKRLPPRAGK